MLMAKQSPIIHDDTSSSDSEMEPLAPCDPQDPTQPAPFELITENVYITDTLTSRDKKRAKRMVCECQFDPELDDSADACGENCLNRLLMIECGSRCPCGEYCNNKKFQRAEYAPVKVFKTEKKGWGLLATKTIPSGVFTMEYCGEVCTPGDFELRKKEYVKDKRRHYYFMSLKTDEILDATRKGNLSRFINHSCDPNCETQKWTVNGRLRIGFFSVRKILAGEELTFDYQFQRFGEIAQKCYCGSANCRGYLGQTKQSAGRMGGIQREMGSPSVREGKRRGRPRAQSVEDSMFEKEVYDIVGSSWRLKDNEQVIAISRIMLRAETPSQRVMLLQVLQASEDAACLRKFLSLHGLQLLWSWMVDTNDSDALEVLQFRQQVLLTLDHLPITNKNQLQDNKILTVVRRWAEREGKVKQQVQENSEAMEGTVVSEADSAPCDGVEGGGGVAGGVTREEEGSCEAEAREASATESQDEGQADEEKLHQLASELLEKWSTLKEVFRIPKRVTPLKKASPEAESDQHEKEEEKEGMGREEGDGWDGRNQRRKSLQTKHNNLSPTWSQKRKPVLSVPKRSSHPSSPQAHTFTPAPYNTTTSTSYNTGYTSQTGFASNTSFTTAAPVQNTVIVQQPGQSVYVQQQVFQDGCQTTIMPTQYVPPPQQYVVQQHPLPLLQPLPQPLPQPVPQPVPQPLSQPLPQPVPQPLPQQVPQAVPQVAIRHPGLLQYPTAQQPPHQPPPLIPTQNPTTQGATTSSQLVHGGSAPAAPRLLPATTGLTTGAQLPSLMALPQQPQQYCTNQQQLLIQPQHQVSTPAPLALAPLPLASLPPPPPMDLNLPRNWKTARDPQGKVYYYHVITRKSQWEQPTDQDVEGTITMDLATPEHEQPSDEDSSRGPHTPPEEDWSPRQPHTPQDSPPPTPTEGRDSDTSGETVRPPPPSSPPPSPSPPPLELDTPQDEQSQHEALYSTPSPKTHSPSFSPPHVSIPSSSSPLHSPPLSSPAPHTPSDTSPASQDHSPCDSDTPPPKKRQRVDVKSHSKRIRAMKEAFRHKLSKVVTHCLDQHRKSDCKYGRITCSEDFKYLARRLTYGLTEKEITRKGGVANLVYSNSVKSKVKDYIRQYMKKFGPVYIRT